MNLLDTIAAISTPFGKGGVALIRISGDCAIKIAEKIFLPVSQKKLSDYDSFRAVYGNIYTEINGKKIQIDDGIATIFRAPKSFTGEDTVEISCHGGVLVTQKVLTACFEAGARPATAGEFTRRAFVNGKMGLNEAEALGNLLEAQTEEQIFISRAGMKGILSSTTRDIYTRLCSVLASVLAHIDYPDEDLAELSDDEIINILHDCKNKLDALLKTYSTGHAVTGGVDTVIMGRTNAGKSSLYNLLVGKDAAIVTDIEGTTRDIISERIKLGRVMVKLSDTAGIRDSYDCVEKIGIDRARAAAENAELILVVFDGSVAPTEDEYKLCEYVRSLSGVKVAIINKSDMGYSSEYDNICGGFEYSVNISALLGKGREEIVALLENIYIDKNLDTGNDAVIVNARQHASVKNSLEFIEAATTSVSLGYPLEICCADIEGAMQALAAIDGREISEDIVSEIFSKFCVGK